MNANEYFKIMEETGKATYRRIEDYLDRDIKEEGLRKFIENFIDGRLQNKRRLRSLLVRGVYNAVTRDDEERNKWKEKILDVCAAFELWCIADYLTNDVFDDKLDKCKNNIDRDPNLFYIASTVVREIAENALRDAARKLRPEKEKEVIGLFSKLVDFAYHHQWADYTMKYKGETPKELETKLDEIFKKRYVDYEAGNCFGKMCEIAAILFGANENERKALAEYGDSFSISLQIVNDIADIATGGYDLKNKLLTYPLVLTMVRTGKNVYGMNEEEVRKLFVLSGVFEECRKIAVEIVRKARKKLHIFEKEKRELLSTMWVFAWTNKYYQILNKIKNQENG